MKVNDTSEYTKQKGTCKGNNTNEYTKHTST